MEAKIEVCGTTAPHAVHNAEVMLRHGKALFSRLHAGEVEGLKLYGLNKGMSCLKVGVPAFSKSRNTILSVE